MRYTHISLHGLAYLLNNNRPHIWEVMGSDYIVPGEQLEAERRNRPDQNVREADADDLLVPVAHSDTTYRIGCTWERIVLARTPRIVYRAVDGGIVRGPGPVVQERFWGSEQFQVWDRDPETELGPHAVECLECKKLAVYCLYERPMTTHDAPTGVRLQRVCQLEPIRGGLIFYRKDEWVIWKRSDRILPWTTEGFAAATPEERVALDQLLERI